MTQLTYTVPTVGNLDTTEEPLIATALTAIKNAVNGNLDTDNLKAAAGVKLTQLEAAANAKVPIGDGTSLALQAISGDATINSSGVITIGNDKITNAKMANDSIGAAEIIDGSVGNDELSSTAVEPQTNIVRPTLHNDGSASTTFAANNTYATTGATFTAAETGLHLIIATGAVTVADVNDTDYYLINSKLYANGSSFGTEMGGGIAGGNAGAGVLPMYIPITHIELASLTTGGVIDLRIKNSTASDGSVTCGVNDLVIKAICLMK